MTAIEKLRAAREKIAEPENWTQRHEARDKRCRPVPFDSSAAVCWCAGGALASCGAEWSSHLFDFMDDIAHGDFVRFNDTHTHAEVLALFDKAITSLEAKGAVSA